MGVHCVSQRWKEFCNKIKKVRMSMEGQGSPWVFNFGRVSIVFHRDGRNFGIKLRKVKGQTEVHEGSWVFNFGIKFKGVHGGTEGHGFSILK